MSRTYVYIVYLVFFALLGSNVITLLESLQKHKQKKNFKIWKMMYKITAYTAKTSNKKYWCQYNLWTGDFPAYIVGCLITCSTHQIARSSGLVIWSFSVEPISLAVSANLGSWRSLSRACNLKKETEVRLIVHCELQNVLKHYFTYISLMNLCTYLIQIFYLGIDIQH